WHQKFIPYYDRMGAFPGLRQVEQKGAGPYTILVLQERCYAFFGSQRQHRVCQPVYVSSPEWLMKFLEKQKISFVVTEPRAYTFGMRRFSGFDECRACLSFEECRARHPKKFDSIGEDRDDVVVEVIGRSEESSTIIGGKQ